MQRSNVLLNILLLQTVMYQLIWSSLCHKNLRHYILKQLSTFIRSNSRFNDYSRYRNSVKCCRRFPNYAPSLYGICIVHHSIIFTYADNDFIAEIQGTQGHQNKSCMTRVLSPKIYPTDPFLSLSSLTIEA